MDQHRAAYMTNRKLTCETRPPHEINEFVIVQVPEPMFVLQIKIELVNVNRHKLMGLPERKVDHQVDRSTPKRSTSDGP